MNRIIREQNETIAKLHERITSLEHLIEGLKLENQNLRTNVKRLVTAFDLQVEALELIANDGWCGCEKTAREALGESQ